MRTQLEIAHALLSDPAADYRDPGSGYHEQWDSAARQARGHICSLERPGWKVTLEPAAEPGPGELITRTAS